MINPVYTWMRNNTIVGESVGNYSVSSLQNGDSVKCIITDGANLYYSNTLHFTVLGKEPVIHILPDDHTCLAPATAYFPFIDLSTEMEDLTLGAILISSGQENARSEIITLPYNFSFGGSVFNQFSVSSNGKLVFGNTLADTLSNNAGPFTNFSIMPWWDKLTTGTNGDVKYQFFIEKEITKIVIEWNVNTTSISAPCDRKFQIRLVENGNIILNYKSNPAVGGTGSATIGIASSNSNYQSVNFQAAFNATTISTTTRFNNNTWPTLQYFSGRGVGFFHTCPYDSVTYGTPKVYKALVDTLVPNQVYQWKKNNINVGINSNIYVDSTLLNNDVITCSLQSTTTCSITSAVSNQIKVNVRPNNYITFNGNGNWSNPANWSSGQTPPANIPAGTAVTINPIPGGQCVIDIPVTFLKGADLIIKPGSNFIVGNNLTLLH
ncbi:MAG: hypothetical protein IPP73_07580 [Chitinophagaceae bacterium]|nr:hypothetical protein [Chitinophagaceae bacterium]